MIRNEKGIALPLVCLFAVVLAIVGLALLGIVVNQAARTVYEEKKTQSYYAARSGADAVAAYIIDRYTGSSLTESAVQDLNDRMSETALGQGSFAVMVKKAGEHVKIEAVGKAGNVSDKVVLNLKSSGFRMEHAIFAMDSINVTGPLIVDKGGSVAAGGAINAPGGITFREGGSAYPGYTGPLPPEILYPAATTWPSKTLVNKQTITDSGKYGNSLNSVSNLFIATNGSDDLQLVFTDIATSALEINVTGTGSGVVRIYMDSLNLSGSLRINAESTNKVVLFVKGALSGNGTAELTNVLLYAPNAVYDQSGDSDSGNYVGALKVKGAIVFKSLNFHGATEVAFNSDISNILLGEQRFKRAQWSGD